MTIINGRIRVNVTGAQGSVGITFDNPPEPGQFIAKAAGSDTRKFVAMDGVTPQNAVALTQLSANDGSKIVGHRNKSVFDYFSLSYPSPEKVSAYGDSITGTEAGGYVGNIQDPVNCYAQKIENEIGINVQRRGVPGGSVMDWVQLLYEDDTEQTKLSVITPGYNDQRFVGESKVFQEGYRAVLSAAVAWAAIPNSEKIKASDSRVQYFGTWQQTPVAPYGFGRYSEEMSAAIALPPIYGDTINLVFLIQNDLGGSITIDVDGEQVAAYDLKGTGTNGIALGNGGAIQPVISYAPRLIRLTGLGPGKHSVAIRRPGATTTDGSSAVHFLWADSGLRMGEQRPIVLLGDTLTMNEAGASSSPPYNSYSEDANASFSSISHSVAANAAMDGMDVQYVEIYKSWSPIEDPANDNIHPTIAGHNSIAQSFLRAMRGVKDYGSSTSGMLSAKIAMESEGDYSFVNAVLQNNWKNLDTNLYSATSYLKDDSGTVFIKGLIKEGSTSQFATIFILPVGMRPSKILYVPCVSFDGVFGCVRIASSGEVQFVSGNNTYLSLDGISFKAEL